VYATASLIEGERGVFDRSVAAQRECLRGAFALDQARVAQSGDPFSGSAGFSITSLARRDDAA
jgi:hypothetical protein